MIFLPDSYPVAFCDCGGVLRKSGLMPDDHVFLYVHECPFCCKNGVKGVKA